MKKVETRLDDVTVAKIEATGMSIYEFLQEAASQKLLNDNIIDLNDSFDRRLREFEKRFETKLVQAVEASRKIHEASIAKDEELKNRISEHLKKIASSIKGV